MGFVLTCIAAVTLSVMAILLARRHQGQIARTRVVLDFKLPAYDRLEEMARELGTSKADVIRIALMLQDHCAGQGVLIMDADGKIVERFVA